jgi:hypothetical protein
MAVREAMVVVAAQAELQAWAAVLMLRLVPMASTVTAAMQATVELEVRVRTERRESLE